MLILMVFFQATQDTIGFVGLGNMGNHMARNLVKKGYKLVIYDVSKDAVGSLKEEGNLCTVKPALNATSKIIVYKEQSHFPHS
jgi:3-hydroxyisobutyrate dehydrogenase-like beta-hydroxyacid dehydrogenase